LKRKCPTLRGKVNRGMGAKAQGYAFNGAEMLFANE
jgi:hypothetical protein